jgi:hypothetical protein
MKSILISEKWTSTAQEYTTNLYPKKLQVS